MSNDKEARRKLRQMFANDLGTPPPADAVLGNLATPAMQPRRDKSDRTEQLNLRVPRNFKKRVRRLATRDDITISEVMIRALDLYEQKYGAAAEF